MSDVVKVVIVPPIQQTMEITTPGPQGVAGPAGVSPQGDWAVDTVYAMTHTVKYQGGMWWAKRANVGVTPVEGDDWTQLVEKGDQGIQGIQGPEGELNGQSTALIVFNGGGTAITPGLFVDLTVDFDSTIDGWTLLADAVGSITIDLRKCTYATFPPTSGDSIVASAPVDLVADVKAQDTALTGWDTVLAAGDILRAYVSSASAVERVSLTLILNRT